jgi:hypothetical protein
LTILLYFITMTGAITQLVAWGVSDWPVWFSSSKGSVPYNATCGDVLNPSEKRTVSNEEWKQEIQHKISDFSDAKYTLLKPKFSQRIIYPVGDVPTREEFEKEVANKLKDFRNVPKFVRKDRYPRSWEADAPPTDEISMTCSVCLESIAETSLCTVPCGHAYHVGCFIDWVRLKKSCPMCRKNLDIKDKMPRAARTFVPSVQSWAP